MLTASVVGVMGLPGHGVSGATKAAVRSFARTWAVELKDHGIRVNVVSPGATDTSIIDDQSLIGHARRACRVDLLARGLP